MISKFKKACSRLSLLSVMLLGSGCSLLTSQGSDPGSERLLDATSYPVLLILDDSMAEFIGDHLPEVEALFDYQDLHYRPEMSFDLMYDPSGFDPGATECQTMGAGSAYDAIEFLGDAFVQCYLQEGGYRALAHVQWIDDDEISINLLDRDGRPRQSYFVLPQGASAPVILTGELLMWMNEQSRFADLRTW